MAPKFSRYDKNINSQLLRISTNPKHNKQNGNFMKEHLRQINTFKIIQSKRHLIYIQHSRNDNFSFFKSQVSAFDGKF